MGDRTATNHSNDRMAEQTFNVSNGSLRVDGGHLFKQIPIVRNHGIQRGSPAVRNTGNQNRNQLMIERRGNQIRDLNRNQNDDSTDGVVQIMSFWTLHCLLAKILFKTVKNLAVKAVFFITKQLAKGWSYIIPNGVRYHRTQSDGPAALNATDQKRTQNKNTSDKSVQIIHKMQSKDIDEQRRQTYPQIEQDIDPRTVPAIKSLDKVNEILNELKFIDKKIHDFKGSKGDKVYLNLDETLTQLLINLDEIQHYGSDVVKNKKKTAILTVQQSIKVLEDSVPSAPSGAPSISRYAGSTTGQAIDFSSESPSTAQGTLCTPQAERIPPSMRLRSNIPTPTASCGSPVRSRFTGVRNELVGFTNIPGANNVPSPSGRYPRGPTPLGSTIPTPWTSGTPEFRHMNTTREQGIDFSSASPSTAPGTFDTSEVERTHPSMRLRSNIPIPTSPRGLPVRSRLTGVARHPLEYSGVSLSTGMSSTLSGTPPSRRLRSNIPVPTTPRGAPPRFAGSNRGQAIDFFGESPSTEPGTFDTPEAKGTLPSMGLRANISVPIQKWTLKGGPPNLGGLPVRRELLH